AASGLVLVAEDDDELRYLIVRALRCDGHDVFVVVDGGLLRAALAAVCKYGRDPDLIVSDVRMPGMSGLEVVAWLRDQGCAVRTVLISAFVDDEMVQAARALGVLHVLSKLFDFDDLRTVVLNVVQRARTEGA